MTDQRPNPTPQRRRPPQMSLGFMLLMTLVFAAMCAGLYRAARVPAVVRDVYLSLGWDVPPTDAELERSLHVYFLLFTYTTPLILAGILSTILNVRKWIATWGSANRRFVNQTKEQDVGRDAALTVRPGSPTSTESFTATE